MELRDFELEIIEGFITQGRRFPRVGVWIRGHLTDVGRDYIYGMWKRYIEFVEKANKKGAKIQRVSYRQFRIYVWFLKKLGLIRVVRHRRARDQVKGAPRAYVELVPEKIDDPAWFNPIRAWEERKHGFRS